MEKKTMSDIICVNCGKVIGQSELSEKMLTERIKNLPMFCSIKCSEEFSY
jgi:hypothetical protein